MRRLILGVAALFGLATAGSARLLAQGVTTGALTGTVTDEAGQAIQGAQVQLRNTTTGRAVSATTRSTGLYLIQGLEPDANYVITVRYIGYEPQSRSGIAITLGQTRREDFKLSRRAAVLEAVTVSGVVDPVINATKSGTSTTISDSALHRLPTLNRNFQDFVSLVPQVSTTTGYLSGGGVNLRQNAIQIDGAQSGDMFGLGTTGQPGSQANAKSIPLDAVKEYQVLLSPFDVRQGNFGGLLINAVTRSGTNDWHGSVYAYTRDSALTRVQPYLGGFTQQQFGGTLGGPILRDKAFFFVSGEIQRQKQPTTGPWIGAPDNYVAQASIDQLAGIMSKYGLSDVGSGEQVTKQNPNRNLFVRLDANLPWNSRLVLRNNYIGADNTSFGRGQATSSSPNFTLTSNSYDFSSKTNSTVAELITNLTSGAYNELLINRSMTKDFRSVPVVFPQITVRGIPRTDNTTGKANFVIGTEASSQGNSLDQYTTELTDNFTIPWHSHSITLGTKNIFYRSINLFAQNKLGNWTFNSLDSLNRGLPASYVISAPAPTDPNGGIATVRANMYGFYAQDQWTVTPRMTLTYGLRVDKPSFVTKPPENDIVFQQYGRHTSSVPTEAQWSPRLGFNWDVTGDQRNQLRGGIGSFAGGVPFVYLSNAFGNSGLSGFSSLTCSATTISSTATVSNLVPAFSADAAKNPPLQCASGTRNGQTIPGATVTGPGSGTAVNTIDPNFKYPKYLKGTLGYDRRLGDTWVASIEGLYTKSQQNAFYQNLALKGPTGTVDAHGRVLYGTFTPTTTVPATIGNRTQVLDLTNASGDYTWSITTQLQKSFSRNFEGLIAYTYQQARDVVSVTSSTAGSNYRYQRDVSGRLDDMSVTRSKYDMPHKIVATGTYRTPWAMDLSAVYTGNSGAPFDFVYGNGDANADGQTQNDLMYVPKNANDKNEILFNGYNGTAAQQATATAMAQAFESYIANTPCLNSQRGTIMQRNSCRNPWQNEVDVSIAQSLGKFGGRRFENLQARLDIINFGNLLNKNWGHQAFSDQGSTCGSICSATVVLTQNGWTVPTGQTAATAQGIYTFNQAYQTYSSQNASSNYRMQLSMRYSF